MSSPRARREQERQRRLAEEEARRRADQRTRRNQRIVGTFGVLLIVALVVGLVFAARRSGTTTATGSSITTSTAPLNVSSTTAPANEGTPVSVPPAPAGASITGPTPCPAEDGSSPRTTHFAQAPPTCVAPGSEFIVTISTTKGDIKALVSTADAPAVVNNFIVLARYHYWDGAPIGFIKSRAWFQAGSDIADPPGVTSPGYTIQSDAPPQAYTPVTLAMAVEPGTKTVGGDMVVAVGEQVVGLPQTTPVIGLVLDGAEVIRQIGQAGTQAGQPTQVITISKVLVEPSTASATTSTTTG